jgi:hypothetical protein
MIDVTVINVERMLTGGVRTMVFGLLILFALTTLLVLLKNIWKDKKIKEGNAFLK